MVTIIGSDKKSQYYVIIFLKIKQVMAKLFGFVFQMMVKHRQ